MELWIRSQDREILKESNDIIEIRYVKNYIGYGDGWAIFVDKTIMGVYKTKERALEVLDEIQNALLENDRYDYSVSPTLSNITANLIYEMPKE